MRSPKAVSSIGSAPGEHQTPWTASVDGGGFDLTNVDLISAARLVENFTTTATAAGTTTLTVDSNPLQAFTGVTTQTITLPVVTTLPKTGFQFYIMNNSTGALTVNSSGGNLVQTMAAGTSALFTCVLLTGTTAASWDSAYIYAPTNDGALYVSDYATLQLAFDAFAASSAKKLVFPANASYTITATLTTGALVGKIVEGNNSTITMSGAGTLYGLELTGVWSNSTVRDLSFATANPGATHIGIVWGSSVNYSTVENCTFTGLYQGISYSGAACNNITGVRVTGSYYAGLYLLGEYVKVSNSQIYSNIAGADAWGILVLGGNNSIVNNDITYNEIGIEVATGGANSDHGIIANNFVSHNRQCNIYLNGTLFNTIVVGNQINASATTNLGAAPQDSSFGMYIKGAIGCLVQGNNFLNNKFSLAIEGISKSTISGNTFDGVATTTTNHISEVGGTNVSTIISGNILDNTFTGSNQPLIGTGCTFFNNTINGVMCEYVRTAANFTSTSTTPADITGMTGTILQAGRTYTGTLTLLCSAATAADGFRVDFDGGTATATDFRAMGTIADTVSVRPLAMTSAIATDITDTTTTGDTLAVIKFTITVNAAGTFIPRYAKEADAAGATNTVYRGSVMQIEDVTA